ncbi:MAG TPA: PilZ domain-containing protein, partial [bacterium]|nr:PilZ domain-containing protein [bacterium]
MKETKSFLKHRAHSRAKVKIPVQLWAVDDPKESQKLRGQIALAKDLSLEGLYIKTGQALKVWDVVRLEVYLPKKTKYIYAFAEVVRIDAKGAGLRLLLMPEEDKDAL